VATCEHMESASFSTDLQLMGGHIEPREPSRYYLGNTGLMAPEDPGANAASHRATSLDTPALALLVSAVPCGAPPVPGTSVASIATGRR
jgi:hypothetical protein